MMPVAAESAHAGRFRSMCGNAGVGPTARADAQVILEGIKKTVTESKTKESNDVVWQRQLGSGSTVETMTLPSFTGPQRPVFNAPGGLVVQVPAGELTTQIQTLSQQPGMGGVKLGDKGLDAVYKVSDPDVDYLFVEYKYNTSRQGTTADGLQASMSWVTGSNRIDNAVGDKLAPSVRASANSGRTETLLIQTLPDGRTNVKLLDVNGKSIPISQSRLDLVQRISSNLNKGIQP